MSLYSRRSFIPFYFQACPPFHMSRSQPWSDAHPSSPQLQLDLNIASHDLPCPLLCELREDLEITNTLGAHGHIWRDYWSMGWLGKVLFLILFFSMDLCNYRPLRHFLNGTTRPVAASRLENFEGLIRPLCPHASNGFWENCEMHVHCKTQNGKVTWVFQVGHDGCSFLGEWMNPFFFLLHFSMPMPLQFISQMCHTPSFTSSRTWVRVFVLCFSVT